MKKYMPLEGLRWSRDSGSALCDTPPNSRSRTGWGGILNIVLSGGDAETNAAVAGAILGAKFGINQIPEEWRNGLLYASMLHDKVQNFYAMYR